MAKALSSDLRSRVVAAIDGGLSCRQAAVRFGVSAASAIRWAALRRRTGDATSALQGGDRRFRYIEAHTDLILGLVEETPDITLTELRARLGEQGIGVGLATLWRFFDRRRITVKKTRHTPPSKIDPTS